jgi:hypothetical protein
VVHCGTRGTTAPGEPGVRTQSDPRLVEEWPLTPVTEAQLVLSLLQITCTKELGKGGEHAVAW